MATFTFKAVDLAGVPARGELEAESRQSVTDQLRERGLIVLDINEQKTTLTNFDLMERFRRIKPAELTVMTRQLATMVASGMSILRCFHVLEETTENDKLKEILANPALIDKIIIEETEEMKEKYGDERRTEEGHQPTQAPPGATLHDLDRMVDRGPVQRPGIRHLGSWDRVKEAERRQSYMLARTCRAR